MLQLSKQIHCALRPIASISINKPVAVPRRLGHLVCTGLARTVLIKGLSPDFLEQDVPKYFAEFGKIEKYRLLVGNPKTKTLVVVYKTLESGISCKDELDQIILEGRRINVDYIFYRADGEELEFLFTHGYFMKRGHFNDNSKLKEGESPDDTIVDNAEVKLNKENI